MIDFLKGKKSYFVAGLMAALSILKYTGKIDDSTYQSLIGLLGAGAVSTVSAKINRMNSNE